MGMVKGLSLITWITCINSRRGGYKGFLSSVCISCSIPLVIVSLTVLSSQLTRLRIKAVELRLIGGSILISLIELLNQVTTESSLKDILKNLTNHDINSRQAFPKKGFFSAFTSNNRDKAHCGYVLQAHDNFLRMDVSPPFISERLSCILRGQMDSFMPLFTRAATCFPWRTKWTS